MVKLCANSHHYQENLINTRSCNSDKKIEVSTELNICHNTYSNLLVIWNYNANCRCLNIKEVKEDNQAFTNQKITPKSYLLVNLKNTLKVKIGEKVGRSEDRLVSPNCKSRALVTKSKLQAALFLSQKCLSAKMSVVICLSEFCWFILNFGGLPFCAIP